MTKEDVPRRIAQLLGRRAQWASPASCIPAYDGFDRTVEVFDADAGEQRALLRELRGERPELERAAGGPLVIVFHTRARSIER